MDDRDTIIARIKAFDWWNYGLDNAAAAASDDWAIALADEILAAPGSAPDPDARVETEAWRLLLDGAESYVEDAENEDPDDGFTDAEFDVIRDRAMDLIEELRTQHGVSR